MLVQLFPLFQLFRLVYKLGLFIQLGYVSLVWFIVKLSFLRPGNVTDREKSDRETTQPGKVRPGIVRPGPGKIRPVMVTTGENETGKGQTAIC